MRYLLAIVLIALTLIKSNAQQSTIGSQVSIDVAPSPASPTSGLQDALDRVPRGIGWGTNTTGALIRLKAGDYYVTNSIFYSNTYISSIRIQGAGILATRIIYAGQVRTNLLRICGGGNPNGGLSLPIHVELEDITFTSITNDTIALVVLTNTSSIKVRDCNFTGWEITTNNTHGPQLSIDGPYPSLQPGNVGLVVGNLNDHATFIENCFFANLATGIHSFSDHLYATGLKTAFIGVYIGGGSGADGTGWANTSPYSLGASILLSGGLGAVIDRPHFYIVNGAVACDVAQTIVLMNPQWEGVDHALSSFDPANTEILVNEPTVDSDETKWAITHSPYAYSSSTTLDVRQIVASKMITGIGLNGNGNVATNFQVSTVQTNLMSQPAAGFSPNLNRGYEVARTNTGPVVFALVQPSTIAGDFIHYYFAINNTGASDQALIFPAPYITNGSGSGPFRVTNICYGEIFGTVGVATNVVIHQGK